MNNKKVMIYKTFIVQEQQRVLQNPKPRRTETQIKNVDYTHRIHLQR